MNKKSCNSCVCNGRKTLVHPKFKTRCSGCFEFYSEKDKLSDKSQRVRSFSECLSFKKWHKIICSKCCCLTILNPRFSGFDERTVCNDCIEFQIPKNSVIGVLC